MPLARSCLLVDRVNGKGVLEWGAMKSESTPPLHEYQTFCALCLSCQVWQVTTAAAFLSYLMARCRLHIASAAQLQSAFAACTISMRDVACILTHHKNVNTNCINMPWHTQVPYPDCAHLLSGSTKDLTFLQSLYRSVLFLDQPPRTFQVPR